MTSPSLTLLAAVAVDLLLGEPPALLHPVVWMGKLQTALRRLAPRSKLPAFAWGALMALAGPLVFGGLAAFVLARVHGLVHALFALWLFKSAFAVRALAAAAQKVANALAREDHATARAELRSLVSRDTTHLPPHLLAAAAIESVAENTSDSFVAPLFFYLVGGIPAALAYRAVNTLDAMIGYRGELEWLGKAAARLDDLANLLPARLTALLLAWAAPLGGGSFREARAIWRRDGALTASPNAGHPMATMAGALGVCLEKRDAHLLGKGLRLPGPADIGRAVRVMAGAVALMVVLSLGVLGLGR